MTRKAKTRDIQVDIARNPKGEPPLLFSIDKSKLTFKNENHPGFLVRFMINDPHGTGYVFPNKEADAMWVQPIAQVTPNSCPTSAMHWAGFSAVEVVDQNKTLVVSNPNGPIPNGIEQLFAFTLRFTDTPSAVHPEFVDFDPIGTNKNGPVAANNLVPAVVALLVIGAAFAAYKLFLS